MGTSSEGKVCPSFSLHCFPSLQADSSEQPVTIAQGFQKPGQAVSSKPGFICALRHVSWKQMVAALVITTNIRQHFFWESPFQCSFSRDTRLRPLPWHSAPREVEGFTSHSIWESFFSLRFEADFLSCFSSSPCLLSPKLKHSSLLWKAYSKWSSLFENYYSERFRPPRLFLLSSQGTFSGCFFSSLRQAGFPSY